MTTFNLGDKPDASDFELKEGETYTALIEERRTWRERLFSWPWRPWRRYNVIIGDVAVGRADRER